MNNKRIALLNLQVDANFGGHLQRFALIRAMQRMGYDVTHLNTRFPSARKSVMKRLKGGLKRLMLYSYYAIKRNAEYKPLRLFKYYIKHEDVTEAFYDKYIPHTKRIFSNEELAGYTDYDYFIVGSDQVWRKNIAAEYGLFTYLFDYLPEDKKRIAYGASLGTSVNELTEDEIATFRNLYSRFTAASVREKSGLDLLASYDCKKPNAKWVLDPTLLLTSGDYDKLIRDGRTEPLKEKIFCYILDMNEQKAATIQAKADEKGLSYRNWLRADNYTVEQWLRSFRDAEFVITDSYHGLVFSLIFNKPFCLLRNDFRGNARFESIAEQLGVNLDAEEQDYKRINKAISDAREQSIRFLKNSIC